MTAEHVALKAQTARHLPRGLCSTVVTQLSAGIWFDSNAIHTIENLSHLRGLKFLYLRQNCIRELGGLDELYHLEVLDVSANFISKIENLDNLR